MKIIVNDANILIDLVELELLPQFFQLDFEFHTTDLILEELLENQFDEFVTYIESGRLIVNEISEEDLVEIINLQISKPTLSEQDCSAIYQAENKNAILITSDNALRKFAKQRNVDVHGHLWVFDCLVDNNILTGDQAKQKLEQLTNVINPKLGLPAHECSKRIRNWLL